MAKKVFKNLLTSGWGSVIMCKVKKLTILFGGTFNVYLFC